MKGELSGYWSRRIDDEHRLVYRADEKEVKVLEARYHYRRMTKAPQPRGCGAFAHMG